MNWWKAKKNTKKMMSHTRKLNVLFTREKLLKSKFTWRISSRHIENRSNTKRQPKICIRYDMFCPSLTYYYGFNTWQSCRSYQITCWSFCCCVSNVWLVIRVSFFIVILNVWYESLLHKNTWYIYISNVTFMVLLIVRWQNTLVIFSCVN